MKALALGLAVSLAAAHTVSFSDCCRGVLCSQKDDCPPCGTSSAGDGCCDPAAGTTGVEDEEDGKPCAHVEPSTEIASIEVDGHPDSPTLVLRLDSSATATAPGVALREPAADPPFRSRERSPLYLLDRTFRI